MCSPSMLVNFELCINPCTHVVITTRGYAFQHVAFHGWVLVVVLFTYVVACISFVVVIRVEICTRHNPKCPRSQLQMYT
jgi:hypothetical protein